jgi:hypothetical protein
MASVTLLAFSVGCASSTVIRSDPSGATVYIDGSKVGKTPYTHSDTKVVGSHTRVELKMEGYEEFETGISRNEEFQVGACIGGVLFLVPFLWVMGYKSEHNYELTPMAGAPAQPTQQPQPAPAAPGAL